MGTEYIRRVLTQSQRVWSARVRGRGQPYRRPGPQGTVAWALQELASPTGGGSSKRRQVCGDAVTPCSLHGRGGWVVCVCVCVLLLFLFFLLPVLTLLLLSQCYTHVHICTRQQQQQQQQQQ